MEVDDVVMKKVPVRASVAVESSTSQQDDDGSPPLKILFYISKIIQSKTLRLSVTEILQKPLKLVWKLEMLLLDMCDQRHQILC